MKTLTKEQVQKFLEVVEVAKDCVADAQPMLEDFMKEVGFEGPNAISDINLLLSIFDVQLNTKEPICRKGLRYQVVESEEGEDSESELKVELHAVGFGWSSVEALMKSVGADNITDEHMIYVGLKQHQYYPEIEWELPVIDFDKVDEKIEEFLMKNSEANPMECICTVPNEELDRFGTYDDDPEEVNDDEE